MANAHPKSYRKAKAMAGNALKNQHPEMSYEAIGGVLEVPPSNLKKWIVQLEEGRLEEDTESIEKIIRRDVVILDKKLTEKIDCLQKSVDFMKAKVDAIFKMQKDEHDEIKADAAKAIENLNSGHK